MFGIIKMIEMSPANNRSSHSAQNINLICVAIARHTLLGDVGLAGDVGMLTFKIHVEPLFHCRNWGAHGPVG